jgi:hypothetical protein
MSVVDLPPTVGRQVDYAAALSDEVQALAREFDLSAAVRRSIAIDITDDLTSYAKRVRVRLWVGTQQCAMESVISDRELTDRICGAAEVFRQTILTVAKELFIFANPLDTSDLIVRR